MKKTVAILLITALALCLFGGCKPAESTPETTAPDVPKTLSVGFGRADITPTESVPLDGLGGTKLDRMSEEIDNALHANCIAFTDGAGQTFLMIIVDMVHINNYLVQAKSDISKETGVPFANIWVGATHNHSAPAMNVEHPAIEAYAKVLRQKIVQAGKEALEDRKPAKMYITEAYPEGLNFVRHYQMSDGSVAGDNFGDFQNNTIVGHVGEADNQMQIIKFEREGAKDIILANWQGHPTGHSGSNKYTVLSCETVFTDKLEAELDCHAAYILGASGNVNNSTRIAEEKVSANYVDHYQRLAQYAIDAMANLKEVEIKGIEFLNQEHSFTTNNGIETRALALSVASIGGIAFTSVPYEMFSSSGVYIKENSPYEMTFISTCTNGYSTYMPTKETFDYESYETRLCKFMPGIAEDLADIYVDMLKQLSGQK